MMDARKIVYDRLVGLPELSEANVFSAGTTALETPPSVRPFVVVEMGQFVRALAGAAGRQTVRLFVHDDQGSRTGIDSLLTSIRSQMEADTVASEGSVCGIDWELDDQDRADEFYNTIYRAAQFVVAGRTS